MSAVQHVQVAPDEADQRLDRWFKRRFPHIPHGRIEKMLRKGEIRIDGARAKAADRVSPGQSIRIPPLPDPESMEDRPLRPIERRARLSREDESFIQSLVLYRDDAVIALNKPAGIPVQGGTGQSRHIDGLLAGLSFGREDLPRLVHRLDKDTSGVLLLARTGQAAVALARSFRSRATEKIYWAAVSGVPRPKAGTIRYGLVKAPGHGPNGAGEKMICLHPDEIDAHEGAKPARTDYATVDSLSERAAWVALKPITGRTHQLRAHMAELGCPVVGDGKYGTNRIEKEHGRYGAQLGGEISRKLHLHARKLTLPAPDGKGTLSFTAPLPEHMRRTWAQFGWQEEDLPEDLFPQ
ncbi:MAG: RluA family pseudouridine synthase [Neomegalonema sp.]|nr:RluA family pseudouridine synthase [Neomegalonema sp.]